MEEAGDLIFAVFIKSNENFEIIDEYNLKTTLKFKFNRIFKGFKKRLFDE